MDQTSIRIIELWSAHYGVPAWIPLCIAYVETGIDPTLIGDQGTSYGLFQLHTPDGQGDVWTQYGSSPKVLLNPSLNAQIGIAPIAQAYRSGVSRGFSGFDLLTFVASFSGHPDDTGYMPGYYLADLQRAYAVAQELHWMDLSSSASAVSPYSGSVHASLIPGSPSDKGTYTPPSAPQCAQYGTYQGAGPSVGVHEGLYLFSETVNGTKINSVVDASCQLIGQYTHKVTTVESGSSTAMNKVATKSSDKVTSKVTSDLKKTATDPTSYAVLAVGLGLGLAGLYYLERQHGIRFVGRRHD